MPNCFLSALLIVEAICLLIAGYEARPLWKIGALLLAFGHVYLALHLYLKP